MVAGAAGSRLGPTRLVLTSRNAGSAVRRALAEPVAGRDQVQRRRLQRDARPRAGAIVERAGAAAAPAARAAVAARPCGSTLGTVGREPASDGAGDAAPREAAGARPRRCSAWAAARRRSLGGDFNLARLELPGFACAGGHDVDHVLVRGLEPVAPRRRCLERGHCPTTLRPHASTPPSGDGARQRGRVLATSSTISGGAFAVEPPIERRLAGRTRSRAGSPAPSSSPAIRAASVSAMSIPAETPAAVMILPCSTTRRSPTGRRAVLAQRVERQPVRRRLECRRGSRRRRAAASRCTPTSSTRASAWARRSQPSIASSFISARVPKPAGDDDHLGLGQLVEASRRRSARASRSRSASARASSAMK